MPPFPGEETLVTVFVDAHTYFGPPTPRPILHRFDKSSYFYVYYNSTSHTSRIEVAINPGTPDQAAFNGYLDTVTVSNSDKFPTRLTLVVDGNNHTSPSPTSVKGRDPDEWRLASADPRDTGTTKYRIHTIDFYFWAQEDAKLILDFLSRLLEPHQLDIDQVGVQSEHEGLVSPVVQNLENLAISDPAFRDSKRQGSPPTQSYGVPPPPPPPAQPHGSQVNQQASSASPTSAPAGAEIPSSSKAQVPDQNYTPLAYNPAAPAAPEPIAHREDTPPPVDGVDGTGLSAAVHDNPYAYQQQQQYQKIPQQPYGASPVNVPNPYGQYGSPPPPSFGPHATSPPPAASFGPQSQPSFGPQAVSPPPQVSPRTSGTQSFGLPPTSATSSNDSRHPSIAAQAYTPSSSDPNAHLLGQQPPVQTPGTQFYNSINSGQPHKPLAHVQPQYPDYLAAGRQPNPPQPGQAGALGGGYSNYQYASQTPQQPPGQQQPYAPPATAGNPYDVHNQFYQPTEAEQRHHHSSSRPHRTSSTSQQHKPSNAEKLEKGVGKFFRKIEKKIG